MLLSEAVFTLQEAGFVQPRLSMSLQIWYADVTLTFTFTSTLRGTHAEGAQETRRANAHVCWSRP